MPPYKFLDATISSPCAEQTRDGDELRRLSARDRQRSHAALERRHALLEHGRGRVHDARINVAETLQVEKIRGMFGILEDVGRGLVDRNRARSRFGVRAVSCVQRTGTEAEDVVRGVPVLGGQPRKLARECLVRHTSIVRISQTDRSRPVPCWFLQVTGSFCSW